MGIRRRLKQTASCLTCWWDCMTNIGDAAAMFTVRVWLCRAAVHEWMIPTHRACGTRLKKTFMHPVPLQLYILMLQFMFLWLFRETFVLCLVYHLFFRANVKVNISWICFVCSAQFVENIDLFFGLFPFGLAWCKRIKFLYSLYDASQLIALNVW